MKILLVRLQILLILLVVFSPLLYLGYQHFIPQLNLLKYDYRQSKIAYPPVSSLHTTGTKILNSSNQPVILRGVNLISTNWGRNYPTWNPKAIDVATHDWHANVIRTRIYENEFSTNPSQFFLDLETQILAPARKNGLYVIIHPWFGDNDSLPGSGGVKMWLAVAKRYQNDPHIIYDLFAEPHDLTFSDLQKTYTTLIPQVRAIAPNSLIMVTGLDWGRDINAWIASPLPYPNLVYRSNPYNKTGEFESYFGRIAEKYPVFLGEFGTEDKLSMTLPDVQNLLGYANDLGIGWTAWHFTATGCPCLLSDEASFTPSASGSLVKNALTGTIYPYPLPHFDPDPTRLYVYSNFLESGFADYSWGITNKFGSILTTNFHNSSGLYLNTSRRIIPSDYSSFHFTVQTNNSNLFTLRFKSFDNQLSRIFTFTSGDNAIPTSQINLASISGIVFETATTIPDPTLFSLSQLYFQK